MNDAGKLDKATRDAINSALRNLNHAISLIAKKEKCGEDCEQQKREVELLVSKLMSYKEQFT